MSNEITRFNHVTDWGMERDSDGDYVLHSEHEAEIARLRAEVEAYRKDAERYRWLREKAYMLEGMGPAVILAEPDFPIDDHRTEGFVFHGELDKAIDAAMGASA